MIEASISSSYYIGRNHQPGLQIAQKPVNAELKESHKENNLTVHACKIANLRKNLNGTISATKKDYGHFYFDAQGKLVKWIIYND